MQTSHDIYSGGFEHPVFQSQSVFRLIMDAMARPGTVQDIAANAGQPEPLGPAAGAVALTLCDHDTPVWLTAGLAKSPVGSWIAFHTGATVTRDRAEAKFAFLEAGAALSSFDLFALGTQEYPDRSTTLVIEVEALGQGKTLALSGPGIKDTKSVQISGLPDAFMRLWSDNRALFPRGIDLILTAGRQMICLPRTTKITG